MPHSWLPFVGQIFVNCYILNIHFIVVQRYYNIFPNFGFIQAYRRVFPTFGFGFGGAPIPFWLLHIGHRLPPAFSISTEIRTKHEYKYKKGTTHLNYFPVSKNFKCEVSSFLINRPIFLPCCNVKDCVRPHSDSTTAGLTKASLFMRKKTFRNIFLFWKLNPAARVVGVIDEIFYGLQVTWIFPCILLIFAILPIFPCILLIFAIQSIQAPE